MLHATSGIILHITNYSDSSIIAKVYTKKFGLQSYLIRGVRGKKSKTKASLIQPLALVELVVSNSPKTNLQRVTEINIQHPFTDIPYNIIKSSIAIFLNEILFRSLKEEHADSDLFSFIKNSLLILDLKTDSCSNFHLFFLIKLSKFLGFYPQGEYSENQEYFDLIEGKFMPQQPSHNNYLKPETSKLLDALLKSNFENIQEFEIDNNQRRLLLKSLILFYQFHVSTFGEIKSLEVLEQILS